jgi:hypothetical protein
MNVEVTREHARKVIEVVDQGLCSGVGRPVPGQMCVEAAVCYALGEPHGDNPSCVGEAVRRFKIRLNDASWPSNAARAEGLREIAIAQLGSNEIDQREFAKRVTLKVIQQIVPIALRAAAKAVPSHAGALEGCAVACEVAADLAAARKFATAAATAAYAAYAAYAADSAATAAADAAYAAADSAATAAAAADSAAAAAAAATAAADAADSADSAAYAAYAAAETAARVKILRMAADIGVTVLKDMACKGTQWLDLLSEPK